MSHEEMRSIPAPIQWECTATTIGLAHFWKFFSVLYGPFIISLEHFSILLVSPENNQFPTSRHVKPSWASRMKRSTSRARLPTSSSSSFNVWIRFYKRFLVILANNDQKLTPIPCWRSIPAQKDFPLPEMTILRHLGEADNSSKSFFISLKWNFDKIRWK